MHHYDQASVASPAVGHDLSGIPNYGDGYRLLTFRARLTTSAVVANRYPHFQFVSPSGNVIHEVAAYNAQVASTVTTYDLVAGLGVQGGGIYLTDGVSSLPLPDLWFPAGTKIQTKTTALDVGDKWDEVYYSALIGDEWEHLRLLAEIKAQLGG